MAHACNATWGSIPEVPWKSVAIPLGMHHMAASEVSISDNDRRAAVARDSLSWRLSVC